MRPLVDFLIVLGANTGLSSEIAHVADHGGRHACLTQRGDKSRSLLVLDLSYLLFYFLELFVLGADDPLASLRPFLHLAINATVQFRL